MDVLALVESPGHVCCRYRIDAFRNALERAGHRLEVQGIPSSALARGRQFSSACRYDVVVVQRRLLASLELRWLRSNARRLVFDFDDAVFARDSYSTRGSRSRKRSGRFARMMAASDRIIAGNEFLVARALAAGASRGSVSSIPTCVDPSAYPVARHDRGGGEPVRLVWIGSSSTLQGIEARGAFWERLGSEVPGLVLRIICDRSPTLTGIMVESIRWSEETEASDLAAGDIGVSWVPDDLWSRGKCGLKVLQFLAAGLPVVTNPVGVHQEMVEPGVEGFLPTDDDGWMNAIQQLASDPESRRSMGAAGRARAEREYSVEAWEDRWVEAVIGPSDRLSMASATPHSSAAATRRRLAAP